MTSDRPTRCARLGGRMVYEATRDAVRSSLGEPDVWRMEEAAEWALRALDELRKPRWDRLLLKPWPR